MPGTGNGVVDDDDDDDGGGGGDDGGGDGGVVVAVWSIVPWGWDLFKSYVKLK